MTTDLYVAPEISSDVVFRRWAPEILVAMKDGMQRFNQMLNGIPSISDRVLTERLRDLEEARLICRVVHGGPPVRVAYGLTPTGRRYIAPIEAIASVRHGVAIG